MSSEIENLTGRILLHGERLREAREARGLSQRQLAEISGIGFSQIHRYETGTTDPQSSILATLARHLDVSTDYLFGFSDVPQKYAAVDLRSDERRLLDAYTAGDAATIIKLASDRLRQVEGERQADE